MLYGSHWIFRMAICMWSFISESMMLGFLNINAHSWFHVCYIDLTNQFAWPFACGPSYVNLWRFRLPNINAHSWLHVWHLDLSCDFAYRFVCGRNCPQLAFQCLSSMVTFGCIPTMCDNIFELLLSCFAWKLDELGLARQASKSKASWCCEASASLGPGAAAVLLCLEALRAWL